MRTQLTERLRALKDEYSTGQNMLREIDEKRRELEKSLLRISGAIQVLEEELAKCDDAPIDAMPVPTKRVDAG